MSNGDKLTKLIPLTRVTPEMHADVAILAATFDLTMCAVARCALALMLGGWTPFTAGEAREVIREAKDGE